MKRHDSGFWKSIGLSALFLCALLLSCEEKETVTPIQPGEEIFISSAHKGDVPIGEVFSEWRYVPLETTDESLVMDWEKTSRILVSKDSLIYILDKEKVMRFRLNGLVDYVYNKALHAYKNKKYPEEGMGTESVNDAVSSKGLLWPLTGGEASQIEGRALSIDGMSNVIEFLEKLEDEEIEEPIDYLELRGCDESCPGGILVQGNRFLVADNLREVAASAPDTHIKAEEYKQFCSAYIKMDAVEPRSMVKYDKDINVAIKKMEMAGMLRKILPDIDCGACGAPSCEALAADIVREDASLNNCIFMQARFEKEGSLQVSEAIDLMEQVWGKDRFVNKEKSESE